MPPGHRAPTAVRAFSNLSLTHEPGNPQRWLSKDLDTYFTDPDLDILGYVASTSNNGVASAGIGYSSALDSNYLNVRTNRAGAAVITVRVTDQVASVLRKASR